MFLSRLKGTRGENINLSQYHSIECFLEDYVFVCEVVSVIVEGNRDSSCRPFSFDVYCSTVSRSISLARSFPLLTIE